MLKRKNKRGWIRVVEVFFAILVIASIVLIVIQQQQKREEEASSRISDSIISIIREIQLNNSLRTEIVNVSDSALPLEWQNFNATVPRTREKISEKTPSYLECVGKICSTSDPCLLGQGPDKTIYAESVIISSDLETYRPRVLKLFCWERVISGTGPVAVCGNNVVESREQCDDGNVVSGDGCSSSCQNETTGYTYLTSCEEITTPGNYLVSNDLTGTAPNACLNIHDVSGVYIDCQDHSITVPGLITGQAVVKINNTDSFSLKNCDLPVTNVPIGHVPKQLSISRSSNGVVSNNVFSGKGLVNVDYSSSLQILNNIFNESLYQQSLSNNSKIENNYLDWNYSGAGLIISNAGSGNLIKNNVINGRGTGSPSTAHTGFDDGIIIDTESDDIISGNTVYNFWDCGIETLGLIQNTVITNNTVKDSSYCGIGGWYWNSLKNNTFSYNKIDNAGTMFTFNRRYALKPGEEFVYFTDNVFIGNVITNINGLRGYATDIIMDRNDWSELSSDKFIASNDLFTNNDFGTGLGPYISPTSAVVDGGGNKCGPPSLGQSTSPLVCN